MKFNKKQYKVIDIAFQNLALQGRATACWAVYRRNAVHAIKQVWRVPNTMHDEVVHLQRANAKMVKYVPTLLGWEDVEIGGKIDSCVNNRGDWFQTHDCIRSRLLLKEYGEPLWSFVTRFELFSGFLHCAYGKYCT